MSPIAAATLAATVTSSPGNVIERRIVGSWEGMDSNIRFDHGQRLVDMTYQAEVALDGRALIRRQDLPRQPFASADSDQIAMRTRRNQVGVED